MTRHLTLLALLLGLSLSAFAQAQQSKLPPCPKVDISKNIHFGSNGRTESWNKCFGTYILTPNTSNNGVVYEGEFQNGFPNGLGTMIFYAEGYKYAGEFKDGNRFGQGTSNYKNGDKYIGQYIDGNAEGRGTFTRANGDEYVGEFKEGKWHGQGSLRNIDGSKYIGEYKNGKPDGQGMLIFANGNKYVGEFKGGKKHGLGTLTLTDGSNYVGEHKDDQCNGKGTFNSSDGSKYIGDFKECKLHGQGTYISADGQVTEGIWANNEFISAEEINPIAIDSIYSRKLAGLIKSHTIFQQNDAIGNPTVVILIELQPDGGLRSEPKILKSSGILIFDHAIKRAIEKSVPFPPDPSTGKVPLKINIIYRLRDDEPSGMHSENVSTFEGGSVQQKIISNAKYLNPCDSPYPKKSIRLSEQGTVVVRVFIKSDGTVGEVELKSSSGYKRLDDEWINSIKKCVFIPSTGVDGNPIDAWFTAPRTFKLN